MKIIFEILLAGAVASLAATACGDMDSIHEQYSGRPEKIYIGRVDSLKAHGGLNRTMLSWYMNSDPKIDSTVIYWNFRQACETFCKNDSRNAEGFGIHRGPRGGKFQFRGV